MNKKIEYESIPFAGKHKDYVLKMPYSIRYWITIGLILLLIIVLIIKGV